MFLSSIMQRGCPASVPEPFGRKRSICGMVSALTHNDKWYWKSAKWGIFETEQVILHTVCITESKHCARTNPLYCSPKTHNKVIQKYDHDVTKCIVVFLLLPKTNVNGEIALKIPVWSVSISDIHVILSDRWIEYILYLLLEKEGGLF